MDHRAFAITVAATLMASGCDSRSDRYQIHASDKGVVRLDTHSGEVALIADRPFANTGLDPSS